MIRCLLGFDHKDDSWEVPVTLPAVPRIGEEIWLTEKGDQEYAVILRVNKVAWHVEDAPYFTCSISEREWDEQPSGAPERLQLDL